MPGDLSQGSVEEALFPLPQRALAQFEDGDVGGATAAIRQFRAEWEALETRLIAMASYYVEFIRTRLPEGSLTAVSGWLDDGVAPALPDIAKLLAQERAAALLDVIERIEGFQVTGPLRDGGARFSVSETCEEIEVAAGDGDLDRCATLCQRLLTQWPVLHDRLVHFCALCSTYIAEEHGEESMDEAHVWIAVQAAGELEKLIDPGVLDVQGRMLQLLALMRAHTMTAEVSVEEDAFHLDVECSSGLRMWRRQVDHYGVTEQSAPWTFGRDVLPFYCCRCLANVVTLPGIQGREPFQEIEPPRSPQERCHWTLSAGQPGSNETRC